MELTDLLKAAASIIQNNGDDATKELSIEDIGNALDSLVGNGQGGLDLVKFVRGLSQNGLGEIVGSWLGNGRARCQLHALRLVRFGNAGWKPEY